jgi:hypothetical protein
MASKGFAAKMAAKMDKTVKRGIWKNTLTIIDTDKAIKAAKKAIK